MPEQGNRGRAVRHRHRRGLASLLGLAGLLLAGSALAWQGELSLGHDSNLNAARQGTAAREAGFARIRLQQTLERPLAGGLGLSAQFGAEGQRLPAYPALDHLRSGGLVRLAWRGGRGLFDPTWSAAAGLAYVEWQDPLRDSWEWRWLLGSRWPLSTRIEARLGLTGSYRDARSAVFDLDAHSATADLEWRLPPATTLYLGYQYREGDLSGTTASPSATLLAAARALDRDRAYDGRGETAFRLAADAQVLSLGLNQRLNRAWALDLLAQHVEAEADIGTRYRREQWLASLLFQF